MSNILTASAQYASRPSDERYASLAELIQKTQEVRQHSVERNYNVKDLVAMPAGPDVVLQSPKGGAATFTNWSFGQLCRSLRAPASYLSTLPPALASQNINHGLQNSPVGQTANVLVQMPNGAPNPIIRACTSETYGRLWDAELYSAAQQTVFNHRSTGTGSEWQTPPTWDGKPAGLYYGDRDSFVIMVDGGSIVNNPSQGFRGDGQGGDTSRGRPMYRGVMIRNSEVGASSVVIESILFDFICGNHILWGAVIDRAFKRRHVGDGVLRHVIRELGTIATKWVHRSAGADEALINLLMSRELATTRAAVIDELRTMGATKDQAESAIDTCERTESASPRSFWGLASAITRDSQNTEYQDSRYELDRLALTVLQRGRQLVAA